MPKRITMSKVGFGIARKMTFFLSRQLDAVHQGIGGKIESGEKAGASQGIGSFGQPHLHPSTACLMNVD